MWMDRAMTAPLASLALERCPDGCFRPKARNADDCAAGCCSKWYAIRDKEAADECAKLAAFWKGTERASVAPDAPVAVDWDEWRELSKVTSCGDVRVPPLVLRAMCAERDSLRAQVAERTVERDAWRELADARGGNVDATESALRTCEAERDALRKDAERYRWLRTAHNIGVKTGVPWCVTVERENQMPTMQLAVEARLDAAIDAALAQREPPS